jgi:hypothetical protein
VTAPAPLLADQFPVRGVRFTNGRTGHRTRRPEGEQWWTLLEAACAYHRNRPNSAKGAA